MKAGCGQPSFPMFGIEPKLVDANGADVLDRRNRR